MTMTSASYAPPNLGNLTTPAARFHKCGPGGSEDFVLSTSIVESIVTPGSQSETTYKDLTLLQETSAAARTDVFVEIAKTTPEWIAAKAVNVTSSNVSILANPVDGVAVCQASGSVTLVARAADGEVSARDVTVAISTAGTKYRWIAPVSGSLSQHCTSEINSLTAGKGRDTMPMWSTADHTAARYEWNPECWGAGLDNITCMSPWNSSTRTGGGGALITPRHLLVSHHLGYHPRVGATIRYVRPDNQTESFTVTDVLPHPYVAGYTIGPWDIVICKLDRDVPDSIKFAKVLPPDPSPYIPTIRKDERDPYPFYNWGVNGGWVWVRACFATQSKRLATAFLYRLPNEALPFFSGNANPHEINRYVPTKFFTPQQFVWSEFYPANDLGDDITVGDSGAPAFIVVNNELVLLSVWSTVTGGYQFYADATIVNGMLDTLGGGYQLTEVDLSEFPTY